MQARTVQVAAIVLSLLAVTAASIETYRGIARLIANGRMMTHTLTVMNAIGELQAGMAEAEKAARGYAIVEDPAFLAPYRLAIDRIPEQYALIRHLTGDNANQQARLDHLSGLLDATFAQLQEFIRMIGADPLTRAENLRQGKGLSDQLRRLLQDMTSDEERLLKGRSGKVEEAARTAVLLLLSMVGISIVTLCTVFLMLLREGARRSRIEQQLRQLNDDLERRIGERTGDLARANDLLTAIITSSPLAIITLDEHKTISAWNRRAEEIFGKPGAKMLGTTWTMLDNISGIGFARLFGRVAAGELMTGVAAVDTRPDGRRVQLVLSAAPLYVRDNRRRGVVLIIEDVTERRVVEDQLRQAQKMEAVGQLTGGLAHDFNNLLAIIIGNLTFVSDLLKDHPALEPVDAALKGALRGAELTRQLLVFARQQPLQPHEVGVGELVERISTLLTRSLGETIAVRTVIREDVWKAWVDPTQVEAALVNLAINARDAMPGGGQLVIEVKNATLDLNYSAMNPEVKPGEYIELAVSDSGCGIPPEILGRVFEPFFTTKAIGRGSGLGLSMIYGFAKQSGGHVKIYSEVGVGTTVRLYLPRARPRIDFAEAAGDARAEEMRGAGEIILVVEDNADVRDVVCKQLVSLGYQVIEAADGREALALLRGGAEVDLLFTDVVMPGGLSGPELVREARHLRPDLRVLYTSGFPESSRNGSPLARTDPMLSKPYRKQELARRIAESLAVTRPGQVPAAPAAGA
jgi:PAS domain S-box-containing protein